MSCFQSLYADNSNFKISANTVQWRYSNLTFQYFAVIFQIRCVLYYMLLFTKVIKFRLTPWRTNHRSPLYDALVPIALLLPQIS